MTRLILTTDSSGAGCLQQAGIADLVIPLDFRFVWGPLPSPSDLATSLSPRSAEHDPALPHWLDNSGRRHEEIRRKGVGLIELCEQCETVELWIDPLPNAQLMLVQLLDHFRSHGKLASKLMLFQANIVIGGKTSETLSEWRPPAIKILNDHLEAASLAWQAFRQPTPQQWFKLLGNDLSVLPQLRQRVLELLEELPGQATGLGATEMRMLELIAAGKAGPFDVFPGHRKSNKLRVFGYWEVGALLDGLAHCPAPAVSGLNEGPFSDEMHQDPKRLDRYKRSKLKLTALGEAILARTEDFSRHNPVHRWWGGTELTNDRLWRWDPASRALIAP
ncbi:hypothetical protein SAMN05444159_6338 [Bradyrhizobium lablabi]|uniref:DUF1835 domain-containing protein n=1 Tax=Bradyrhizobium lablabi TaxID=722472 RepID=A0A1M7BZG1_9BRAD|nr:hypothetical protein [Bradyrhizobium lablabi]SHL60293.1 hypothetical protein SAMN05444159_6338 [Bradyrhizobium lablabi]